SDSRDREGTPPVARVMVATDRSLTADQAVEWATRMARQAGAELVLLQVLPAATGDGEPGAEALRAAGAGLERAAHALARDRGRAVVVADRDPAAAITRAAAEER